MNDVHSLKNFKDAKTLLPHIEKILYIFDLTEKSLGYYKSYIPAAKVLRVIIEQKKELQLHRDFYKKVKESKGKKT